MNRRVGLTVLALILVVPALRADVGAVDPPGSSARVSIGPNVQISLDGDFPHVEPTVAAHPTDPHVLVVAAVTTGGPAGAQGRTVATRTYASDDGGSSWYVSHFDKATNPNAMVAFGPDAAVYFSAIGMPLYRSFEGGLPETWEDVGMLGAGDHPMMAIDHSGGPHHGRVYVSSAGGLLHRIDPGDPGDAGGPVTIREPVRMPEGSTLSERALVLGDGTLFVPFTYIEALDEGGFHAVSRFFLSEDGGETFDGPRVIVKHPYFGSQWRRMTSYPGSFLPSLFVPRFAVDGDDRILMAWHDTPTPYPDWLDDPETHSPPRVFFTASSDRGRSWAPPRPIDLSPPAHSAQWQPMLAVNDEGTIAVAWLDTRDDPAQLSFHVYVAVSTDGGTTFTEPRRVSTRASHPMGAGNRHIYPAWRLPYDERTGTRRVSFNSAFRRWAETGDYLDMAATADGVFHPIWVDGRTGTYHLYTSRIRVLRHDEPVVPVGRDLVDRDVTEQVELRFDLPGWDDEASVSTFPIRLYNAGADTLHPPLTVDVVLEHFTLLDVDGRPATTAVDYSGALGDPGMLAPGAITEARVWRVRHDPAGLRHVPRLTARITARVTASTEP